MAQARRPEQDHPHTSCVNPLHVRWASLLENNRDRNRAGTQPRGRKINTNRHTESEVLAIYNAEGTLHQIAAAHDATVTTVHNIRSGLSWSWLTQGSQQAIHRIIETEDTP